MTKISYRIVIKYIDLLNNLILVKSMELLSLFTKSLVFGSVKHRHQLRDTGEVPYINHPIEVADILARAGVTDF